jgi:predicted O-methyltransferase YrrM
MLETWTAVDRYLTDLLVPADLVLDAALEASAAAGLPPHQVSPTQGRLLELLARAVGTRRILEIGTLGGYSTIWLARALPSGGHLVTLEANPHHSEVARANLERAGLHDRVELRVGPALETLPTLHSEGAAPFDLSFIDADKASSAEYFDWSLRLSRPGSLILIDNVVRRGAVADPTTDDPSALGIRRLNQRLAVESRVRATAIQTVGSKSHDGFALALVGGAS